MWHTLTAIKRVENASGTVPTKITFSVNRWCKQTVSNTEQCVHAYCLPFCSYCHWVTQYVIRSTLGLLRNSYALVLRITVHNWCFNTIMQYANGSNHLVSIMQHNLVCITRQQEIFAFKSHHIIVWLHECYQWRHWLQVVNTTILLAVPVVRAFSGSDTEINDFAIDV